MKVTGIVTGKSDVIVMSDGIVILTAGKSFRCIFKHKLRAK